MRLLLLTNRYPVDADDSASPFVPHFVAAVREQGVTVDVMTPDYGASQRPSPRPLSLTHVRDRPDGEGERVHRFVTGASEPVGSWNLTHPGSWLRLRRFLSNGLAVGRDLCQANYFDHILALWAFPSGHFARKLAGEFGINYSVWCLGSDIYRWANRPMVGGLIGRVMHDAEHIFGDGEDLCRRVRGRYGLPCEFLPSFRPLDVSVVPCPPKSTSAPRFLYLGRLHRDKGVLELLEALALVRQTIPDASLRLVGDGPAHRDLRDSVHQSDLEGHVSLTGRVPQSEIVAHLSDCDFVVIPTKTDSLPLVFSEAVQINRPVIGTDVGDLGLFIRRYRVGIVTRSVNPPDLAEAMTAMAQNPIFNPFGRTELLKLLDPKRAAVTFLSCVYPGRAPVLPSQTNNRPVEHSTAV